MKVNKNTLILIFLTLIGFALRLDRISTTPPSLNWDEVSHGYNAFSILKTAKDEWGVFFPTIFRAFGDYKLPLYIYLTAIPVSIFGLSSFSVRLVSVLAGTFAIPGIYLLANSILKRLKYRTLNPGLIAAFLLTISPWHFFISRPALEANLSLTLLIFAGYFLLEGRKKYLISSILFSLSIHTYNTARVFTPLTLLTYLLIFKPKLNIKKILLPSSIFITSLLLVVFQIFNGTGTARYDKLSIINQASIHQIETLRNSNQYPQIIERLIYNRPVYFTQEFVSNYISYFSPWFLYQAQGSQEQFAIPAKNLFTLPVSLLNLLGIMLSIKKLFSKNIKGKKNLLFLFSFYLLSPVAAALTSSPPQALRPNPLIPPTIIFATIAIVSIHQIITSSDKLKRLAPLVTIYLLTIVTFSFTRYWYFYHKEYRQEYSQVWQYGYQEAFEYIKENGHNYDRVFVSKHLGEPHIFYAYFNNLDPRVLQPDGDSLRFEQSDWFWTDRIGSVYFVNDWDIPSYQVADTLTLESGEVLSTKNSLLLSSASNTPSNGRIIKFIEHLNGNIAFVVSEFK